MLDWSVVCSELRADISPWRVARAEWRDRDCENRDWAAVSDCAAVSCRFSAIEWDTARRRVSFSGFGGIGGAGPEIEGSSTSNGEVRRSGVSVLGPAGGGRGLFAG